MLTFFVRQPRFSRTNVTNGRENSVNLIIFHWGKQNGEEITKATEEAYKTIVTWKKNLFMLPTGAVGKRYITEVTN